MSPPEVWGPPIWTFLHTLVEKINERKFSEVGPGLVFHIRRIIAYLPCPDCSRHATNFFVHLPPDKYRSKKELKNTLFVLHNLVNKPKHMYGFCHVLLGLSFIWKKLIYIYIYICVCTCILM